jgi:hypothetical protein
MAEPRRLICSRCEYQAPWMEFRGEEGGRAPRCPRCGSDTIRFADYEPSTYGGLTADQWELVRELAARELRSGLLLTGQKEELEAIVGVAEEVALPAITAIDEVGVFGFLEEATAALQQEEAAGELSEEDWPEDARAELLAAVAEAPDALRETLVELVDGLCEALSEREAALVASVALASGLGGELERDTEAGDGVDANPGDEG